MPSPDFSTTSDQDLIARFLDGDEAAYTELDRRHRGTVFKKILAVVNHRARAEELTQETFSKALDHLHRFRPDAEFRPWIGTIADNTARDYVKLRVFRSNSPLADDLFDPYGNPWPLLASTDTPTPHPDPLDFAEALDDALAQLRYDHRRCLVLHLFDHKTYEEISAITGINIGTVGSHIARARKRLKRMLRPYLNLDSSDPSATPA